MATTAMRFGSSDLGRWLIILAIALLFAPNAALAKNMTFALERTDARSIGLDLYQIIWADGEITPSTGNEFRAWAKQQGLIPGAAVYLNSTGGSVIGGMQLGNAIRDLGFETYIGRPKNTVGMCLSACVYAYLGGTFRYIDDKSVFGVHRFSGTSDADLAQVMSGIITAYIEKMGAKPLLFSLMTVEGPDEILPIPHNMLKQLNVVNDGVASTVWDVRNVADVGFYLRGTTVTDRGTHKLLFLCHDRVLYAMPMLASPDPDRVVRRTGKINWIVDGEWLPPLPTGAGKPKSNGSEVSTSVLVSSGLFQRLRRARSIGFAWQDIGGQLYAGFEISIAGNADKLETFAQTCNQAAYR